MKKRPKSWNPRYSRVITELVYDMFSVHRFVKTVLRNKDIRVRYKFFETIQCKGLCIFEDNIIFICADQEKRELEITFLHECFHIFFRDVNDTRKRATKNDPVERRAEDSAKNMLQWYNKHFKVYNEFTDLIKAIPKTPLTEKDLEEL